MSEKPDAHMGDRVRIVRDEYPGLVGAAGTITQVSRDGTTAWVETRESFGVWCCRADLSVIPPGTGGTP